MIVITMAGGSTRFKKAGYQQTKYALELGHKSVFEEVLLSFKEYFDSEEFLFITRKDDESAFLLLGYLKNLQIKKYSIFELDKITDGQAETAYIALKEYIEDFPILIFNIDTIRPNYIKPEFINECDGYLEVFCGEGDNWSFIEPGPRGEVIRTTEKEAISNLCSSGLYFFKSRQKYCSIFEDIYKENAKVRGEYYIAPMYNVYIKQGLNIKYNIVAIDDIYFCGTPDEYIELKRKYEMNNA